MCEDLLGGVELSEDRFTTQEVLVSHANAALTPVARPRIGRLVVENGVPVAQAAAMFQVSWTPAVADISVRTSPAVIQAVGNVVPELPEPE